MCDALDSSRDLVERLGHAESPELACSRVRRQMVVATSRDVQSEEIERLQNNIQSEEIDRLHNKEKSSICQLTSS